jgi:hypothetical protein
MTAEGSREPDRLSRQVTAKPGRTDVLRVAAPRSRLWLTT